MSTDIWTIKKVLDWSVQYFQDKQIESPRLNAEWLLCHALHLTRVELYLQFDKILNKSELEQIKSLIKRRLNHEPLQYILGKFEFMGLEFELSPAVLIPRPETEVLVESIIPYFTKWKKNPSVLEIGVGSGCIPVALNHFVKKNFSYYGIEISEDALHIAKKNFEKYKINSDQFVLYQHDFLQGLPAPFQSKQFELIVSNPPYVTPDEWEKLQPEVRDFEPKIALVPVHNDPLIFYKKIAELKNNLSHNGIIAVEMSYPLYKEIEGIFIQNGYQVEIIKDYSQKERILIARKQNEQK